MLLRETGLCGCLLRGKQSWTDETGQSLGTVYGSGWEKKKEGPEQIWREYLDKLAILISNLRMAYDMDIILGGRSRRISGEYDAFTLGEKVMAYNGFLIMTRQISEKICAYKREASTVGGSKIFFTKFIKRDVVIVWMRGRRENV